MDGLDIAFCEFNLEKGKWAYKINAAKTYYYTEEWKIRLRELPNAAAKEIIRANTEYASLCADFINEFTYENKLSPDLISSHGHTVFHEPAEGFTYQIGDGQVIATNTKTKTICDFRSMDISLGGQGAPLVPIGDELLFAGYEFCLNIGGIANISFRENNKRIAYDICAANQLLNFLSLQLGKPFDKNGYYAQLGKLNTHLFNTLNKDAYFMEKAPKSLSNQYVKNNFIDIVNKSGCSVEDKLYTVSKHIAYQVNESSKRFPKGKILLSGGGAHNSFLTSAIKRECKHEIVIPGSKIIDYKEALIFALMGVLKELGKVNCLASVTGARRDCSGGTEYLGIPPTKQVI